MTNDKAAVCLAEPRIGQTDGDAYAERMREAMAAGTGWRVTMTPERWSDYGLSG
tara:strand:+ start:319 stop:480 length:162 start_codon:yes stop_codon:yes gene_type:complete